LEWARCSWPPLSGATDNGLHSGRAEIRQDGGALVVGAGPWLRDGVFLQDGLDDREPERGDARGNFLFEYLKARRSFAHRSFGAGIILCAGCPGLLISSRARNVSGVSRSALIFRVFRLFRGFRTFGARGGSQRIFTGPSAGQDVVISRSRLALFAALKAILRTGCFASSARILGGMYPSGSTSGPAGARLRRARFRQ
jgi:hypothetical protein